jgi:hypothetical protein
MITDDGIERFVSMRLLLLPGGDPPRCASRILHAAPLVFVLLLHRFLQRFAPASRALLYVASTSLTYTCTCKGMGFNPT